MAQLLEQVMNREISIQKIGEHCVRKSCFSDQEALFLLSAQNTELLPFFLCPCSKFLPILARLRQNLLLVVKAQCVRRSREPPTLFCLLVGSITAFTHKKVNVHLCSHQYVTIMQIEIYCSKQRRKLFCCVESSFLLCHLQMGENMSFVLPYVTQIRPKRVSFFSCCLFLP